MTDTNTRFTRALTHLTNVSAELGEDVTRKTALWGADQKDLLSLSGSAAWRKGSDEQHIAIRALLLCTICYCRPPHAAMELASDAVLKSIRDKMLSKSLAFVNDEIRLYIRSPFPTKDSLATAAETIFHTTGNVTAYSRTRADTNVGAGPVCYNGTSTWLFAAGFVSRRWLAKEGSQMLDRTARLYLGEGAILGGRSLWNTIPRGHIFHIHKTGDQNTCHWGVSLGAGRAAACNNTDQAPQRNPDGTKVRAAPLPGKALGVPIETNLHYEGSGNSAYGVFQLNELCDILNRTSKYMVGIRPSLHEDTVEANSPTGCNIVLRHINPMGQADWY